MKFAGKFLKSSCYGKIFLDNMITILRLAHGEA